MTAAGGRIIQQERRTYTSQAAWDREQEIIDEAGGGELVFAEVLRTHWNKIVITDPKWHPEECWRIEAGFDHGKTNPTALLRAYIDHEGVIYFCGEYYMPGKEVWLHAPEIRKMKDIDNISVAYSDPTILTPPCSNRTNPLSQGRRRSARSRLTTSTLSRAWSRCTG